MKFKFRYLALSLGLIVGLASCSNDDDATGTNPIVVEDTGTPTYVKLKISQPRSTYATGDPNATEDEAKLTKVDLFIYNDAGNLVKHQALGAGDFSFTGSTLDEDKYDGTAVIATTTGSKTFYVGVNLPAKIVSSITSSGTIAGVSAVNTITNNDLIDTTSGGTNNGFAMFITEAQTETLVEDPVGDGVVNTINVVVSRLVAKVTVEEASSLDLTEKVAGGTFSKLQFAMGNSNTKIYPYQQKNGAGDVTDPNWSGFNTSYFASEFQVFGDYVPINGKGINVKQLTAKYAPENTSEKYLRGESTYASIRATFIPDNYTDATDGSIYPNPAPSTAATFYAVRLTDGTVAYFEDETDANTYSSANGGAVSEYENGYTYYYMYLNPNGKYNTLRNAYYKATISKINGLGNPNPGPTDPEIPVELPTNIVINIDILFWVVDEYDYELSM